ncbi:MAG: beta-glucuronidase [Marinilabiliaceae bacterium]|nr:beta-glucuronidase [Marinilabiliaceae bacterium]
MRKISFLVLSIIILTSCKNDFSNEMDISGEWTYKLDTSRVGINEKWVDSSFVSTISLPGALRDYNIGFEPDLKTKWTGSIYDSSWYFNPKMVKYRQPGNIKFPFWLTPVKHFVGVAWYKKAIEIPENWENKDLIIHFERPHWQTTVWFDTLELGSDNSLSTPHEFIVSKNILKSGKHIITVRIDNALRYVNPGINSHSVSDHTQGNWNGIIGNMKLIAKNSEHIKLIKIFPNIKLKSVKTTIILSNSLESKNSSVQISIKEPGQTKNITTITKSWPKDSDQLTFDIPISNQIKTWSEFEPNIYEMNISLLNNQIEKDKKTQQFGMRKFSIVDKHFEINDTPIFLRGTTECCVFPKTGYPPTNEQEWARIYSICKSFGLNHIRFHSYCPPKAAFVAADKAGFYLQVEGPSWAKYSTSLGRGKPIDKYLMDETKRIIDTYGNHPSFCMMAYGNEPSGNYVPYLENWVDHFRKYDPQRVFTGASTGKSWAIIENSDFLVRAKPRGLEWKNKQPESLFDYRDKTEDQQKPYVTFEMGQWCSFPNFKEIKKYTGSLKAKNFELFEEDLNDHHMGNQANDFLLASGKLQASCYKQEIEATLRTPNLAGFQLLSLNDFSGQGTALVGVLDAFWDEKGYISATEFKSFCNQVVPLIRIEKYTWETNDTLKAYAEVANFSGTPLPNASIKWNLSNEKGIGIDSGFIIKDTINIGNGIKLGTIKSSLSVIKQAQKLVLSLSVNQFCNKWNVWIYPNSTNAEINKDVFITQTLNTEAENILKQGGKVLLIASGKVENGKDVIQYQTPVFWNTSWFRMRPPHTTGIFIQHNHPSLNDFPTDYYSDLQWWDIANRQQVMNIENFQPDFKPIIQPIDTWFMNRRLAMLFETKIDEGNLMVCSIDLLSDIELRPVARQLRKSILNYMISDEFNPKQKVSIDIIKELFEVKEREGWNSYVNENP